MSFAHRYIERNITQEIFIEEAPSSNLGISVIIPVCNEVDLIYTLDSLAACQPPFCSVEVILVVNESETSDKEILRQNDKTMLEINNWKQENKNIFFKVYSIRPQPFPSKHAGAGLARKTGMDEAISRFSQLDNSDGILVSLDADTLVDSNYLVEIERLFKSEQDLAGATIRFKHRVEEIADERHRAGMILYERYLHYYKRALAYTGFPYAIYTIGSAFAVKANAYVKQGGMSKRQAGEDFYFLHKLTQFGKVFELNTTCVYPSSRISNRVPFGTGPALQKWIDGDDSLRDTYRFAAFEDLRVFFQLLPNLWEMSIDSDSLDKLPIAVPIIMFLKEDGFLVSLDEIQKNSASYKSFEKRFFQFFNAFKILKFLNYSHMQYYSLQDLDLATADLRIAEKVL